MRKPPQHSCVALASHDRDAITIAPARSCAQTLSRNDDPRPSFLLKTHTERHTRLGLIVGRAQLRGQTPSVGSARTAGADYIHVSFLCPGEPRLDVLLSTHRRLVRPYLLGCSRKGQVPGIGVADRCPSGGGYALSSRDGSVTSLPVSGTRVRRQRARISRPR